MMNTSNSIPDRIAECALHHYHNVLPSNNGGKPQKGREWTVYCAIVAICSSSCSDGPAGCKGNEEETLWVVSCATGSKCTSINAVVSSFPIQEELSLDNEDCLHRAERISHYNGLILKDSHAEVLARRGLMAVLWNEIETTLENNINTQNCDDAVHPSQNLLDVTSSRNKLGLEFRLKNHISLHMFVSDSPCGDATIYEIKKLKEVEHEHHAITTSNGYCDSMINAPEFEAEMNFTGAKIILSGNEDVKCTPPTMFNQGNLSSSLSSIITFTNKNTTEKSNTNQQSTSITVGREHIQQLGALRLKSSRSNIPAHLRSTSMSCADKLVRWCVLGLQGSLLMSFIPDPICLSSVCVSRDPRSADIDGGAQLAALDRALRKRVECVLEWLQQKGRCLSVKPPVVAIVDKMYDDSKSASEHRHMMAQYDSRKRTACEAISESLPLIPNKKAKVFSSTDSKQLPSDIHQKICHISGKMHNTKKESPSGMSINWHQQSSYKNDTKMKQNETEITIGATGLKRGKKPKRPEDVVKSASRLCRYSFFHRWRRCLELSTQNSACTVEDAAGLLSSSLVKEILDNTTSYMQTKQKIIDAGVTGNIDYVFSKSMDVCEAPLSGWVRNGTNGDFTTASSSLERRSPS